MRVFVVTHSSGLYGAEKSLLALLQGLSNQGDFEFHILTPGEGPSLMAYQANGWNTYKSFYVYWFGKAKGWKKYVGPMYRLTRNTLSLLHVLWVIRKTKPDLIYSNTLAVANGALLAMILRKPHVWHAREMIQDGLGGRFDLGELGMRWLLKRAKMVICNSRAVQSRVRLSAPGLKSRVIYNGFIFPKSDEYDCLECYDNKVAGSKPIKISIVGYIHPGKGQKEAVAAVMDLVWEGYPLQLSLIGSGSGQYFNDVKVMAEQSGDVVRLLGFRNDIDRLIADSALTLVCSISEAFGRAAVESLGYGVPVVGANTGGVPEVIHHEDTGLLYELGDLEGLKAAIRRILDDRDLYEHVAKTGSCFVRENFIMDHYVANVGEEFLSVGS